MRPTACLETPERNRWREALLLAAVVSSACSALISTDGFQDSKGETVGQDAAVDIVAPDGDADSATPDAFVEADASGDTAGFDVEEGSCETCSDQSLARTPCRPDVEDPPTQGEPLVFALRTIGLGMSPDAPQAWRDLGLDRDCLATTTTGGASCKSPEPTQVEDGHQGRDNGFGRNIGTVAQSLVTLGVLPFDPEVRENDDLELGRRGWVVVLEDFGRVPNDPRVRFTFYMSRGTFTLDGQMQTPAWDGADSWWLDPTSFSTIGEPLWVDDNAYVADHVLVASLPSGIKLVWGVTFGRFELSLSEALLYARLDLNWAGLTAGQLSATWPAVVAVDEMSRYLDGLGLCPDDPRHEMFVGQITKKVDSRVDFAAEPDLACNAISVGVGFTAQVAKLGKVAAPHPPPPEPCTDGGS
jgi:hypothetical protein